MSKHGWLDKKEDEKAKLLVEQFYNEDAPWLRVGANTETIIDKMRQDLDSYPPSIEAVRETAASLGSELFINSEYAEAWNALIGAYPDFDMDANRSMAFQSLNPGEPPSYEAFTTMAQQGLFVPNREAREFEAAEAERERMIAEITNNGKSGFYLRTPNGGKKVYDADGMEIQYSQSGGRRFANGNDGFAAMVDEEVAAIHAQVMEERRLKHLNPSELRKEIQPQRQAIFEASTPSVRPDDGASIHRFFDDTGVEIATKQALIRYLNSAQGNENAKKLLVKNGRVVPAAERRLRQLLGK